MLVTILEQATQSGTGLRITPEPGGGVSVTEVHSSPTAVADGDAFTTQPPFGPNFIPVEAVAISIAFFVMVAFIIVGLPLARAFARRMDRRGVQPGITPELSARVERIEQAVDAIAIEVERISEGQRFTNRLMAEHRSEPERAPAPR